LLTCVLVAAMLLPGPSLWSRVRQRQVFKGQGGFRPDLRGQGYRGIGGKGKKLERFWLGWYKVKDIWKDDLARPLISVNLKLRNLGLRAAVFFMAGITAVALVRDNCFIFGPRSSLNMDVRDLKRGR